MEPLTVTVEGLVYALDRAPSRQGGRAVVTVRLEDGPADAPPLVDRVDLYAFRARRQLARLVADRFGRVADAVLGHLAVLLDAVERSQAEPAAAPEELTAERREEAEALLSAPDLLDRAAAAMTAHGYVGEEATKRLAFLVATSRLLARPLSAILMAPSGCGKSEMLEAVQALLPPEQVEFLSRLTPQALYYAGAEALRHRVVMVDEQAGAAEADYPLRTLQSKGFLTLRVPGRDQGQTFTVRGPIALMSGTTAHDLNPENLSRCLELPLDDSREQTARIQAAQRAAWSGAGGGLEAAERDRWRDAQRVLEPRRVVIPYASELAFPTRTTTDRRGNQKLLGLVAAHALLHQRQRERGPGPGDPVVATPADYAAVYALLAAQVARDLTGLSPRAERVYRLLVEGDRPRTRREVAAAMGWAYNTAKKALGELVDQELVVADAGPPARYRILDASVVAPARELVPPEAIAESTKPTKPKAKRSRRRKPRRGA